MIEFDHRIIGAVHALRRGYAKPGSTNPACPLCTACKSVANHEDPMMFCNLCPHVVIDGGIGDICERPCFHNPTIEGRTSYLHSRIEDDEHFKMGASTGYVEQIRRTRKKHIERCDRWLAVMVPKDGEA